MAKRDNVPISGPRFLIDYMRPLAPEFNFLYLKTPL